MRNPEAEIERFSAAIMAGPDREEVESEDSEDFDAGQVRESDPYIDPEVQQEAAAWRTSKIRAEILAGIHSLSTIAYNEISDQKTETAAAKKMGEHWMAEMIFGLIEGLASEETAR